MKNLSKNIKILLAGIIVLIIGFLLRLEYAGEVNTAFTIDQSVRFNDNDSAYLSKTFGGAGNQKTWTWSGWVKRGSLGVQGIVFQAGTNGSNDTGAYFQTGTNKLEFYDRSGGSIRGYLTTVPVYRDPSAWHHWIFVFDSTNATAADRMQIWVDGIRQEVTINTTLPQNTNSKMNSAIVHSIGSKTGGGNHLDGYLSNLHFIDGQALAPTDFGETDANGYWRPKVYGGTYGTNGFHLDFADSADLGNDVSGNANDWTSNNLDATDQVIDTPTNSFATLNSIETRRTTALTESGMRFAPAGSAPEIAVSNIAIPSGGKWYAEVERGSATSNWPAGIVGPTRNGEDYIAETDGIAYWDAGAIYKDGSQIQSSLTAISNGDVLGIAVDADAKTVQFYANGSSTGTAVSYAGKNTIWIASGNYASGLVFNHNFGQGGQSGLTYYATPGGYFKYEPPTGFKALSTNNLPTPDVTQPNLYFEPKTYTGTGALQSITSLNFQPALTWLKDRTSANAHGLFDALRSTLPYLSTNATTVETSSTNALTAFLENGFTLGANSLFNTNTNDYISWNWKEDADAGFDVVGYSGTGVAQSISHSLGAAPAMMLVKERTNDGGGGYVYHQSNTSAPETDYLRIDATDATVDNVDRWNDTAPTTTHFTVGTHADVNGSDDEYIAYLWAEKEGYSKFGSYTGNGSTDGPFVYTGFKPAYVMVKRRDSTAGWIIHDGGRRSYNPSNLHLRANTDGADDSGANEAIDILSNGFKLRGAGGNTNISSADYIYAAFAEQPFKESAKAYNLTIDESIRLNDDDSAYLSRTPAGAGDRKTWTWSGWVKPGNITAYRVLFHGYSSATNNTALYLWNDDTIAFRSEVSGTSSTVNSDAVFRDPAKWMHITLSVDTTQVAAIDRVKIYVDGEEMSVTGTNPAQNLDTQVNNNVSHAVGKSLEVGTSNFDGYLSDIHFIDGQALTPTDFGETDANGYWRPKAYGGTYGTNGFHLDFADSGDLGNDVSGNANDWTSNNLDATDQVIDTPTNSFTIWNSADRSVNAGQLTIANAGLTDSAAGGVGGAAVGATMSFDSGKWYFEWTLVSNSSNSRYPAIGLVTNGILANPYYLIGQGTTGTIDYEASGQVYVNNSLQTTLSSFSTGGDVIGVAYDAATGKVWFAKNGTWQASGDPATGANPVATVTGLRLPAISHFNGSGGIVNFGQGGQSGLTYYATPGGYFKYEPPTGFKALSTNNLPTPDVTQPNLYFEPKTYTGTGALQSITSLNFQPALTWLKDRTSANAHGLFDALRSTLPYLSTNATTVETSSTNALTAFLENGFTLGANSLFNTNTNDYISWNWKEDADAGFDVVNYTGTGSAHAESHSLSATPDFIMVKDRGATNDWAVYHSANTSAPETDYLLMNSTAATADSATYWNDTSPGYTKLLLHADGTDASTTFTDSSATENEHIITANGNVQVDAAQSKFGGASALFDGSGDYLSIADSEDWTMGANDFTIDFWFNRNGDTGRRFFLGQSNSAGENTSISFQIEMQAGNTVRANANVGGTLHDVISTTTITDSSWHHIAFVRDGSTLRLFIDGIEEDTDTGISTSAINNSVNQLSIGRLGEFTSNTFSGSLDEVRISKGIARWTGNFTPPTSAYTLDSTEDVFHVGTNADVNTSGNEYTAYLWAEKEGYSKFGSYTGNGSADGPFVYLGFKPVYVMVKNTSSAQNWRIFDSARSNGNPESEGLYPNLINAESAGETGPDFLSNGFKIRTSSSTHNGNGNTIIYAAFAEQPYALSAAPAATNYLQRAAAFLFGMQF